MTKSISQFLLFLSAAFICLYLSFSPAVNLQYSSHDSIRYFDKFYNQHSVYKNHYPMYGYLENMGRPVAAELEDQINKKVNHLSDLSQLRLITIIIFAFTAALLTQVAITAGLAIVPAFCLSIEIFTLPGFQDIVFVPYPFIALAVFFSLLGNLILSKKWPFGTSFIFTIILLEMIFFMYPPATFFFLVPAALRLVFSSKWLESRKIWARDLLLWSISAVVFYFILRVLFYSKIKTSGHEIAFTLKQIFSNLTTFLPQAVPQIFNLWNVYYSFVLGVSVIGVILLFIISRFLISRKINWGRVSAIAATFFVFNLVWFLFYGYLPRQFLASQALALMLVYWCGEWLSNFWPQRNELSALIWPIILLCFGLIMANRMISSNVMNNYSELMFMRSRLAQYVNSSTKEIHIIALKDPAKGYNGLLKVYDNINSTTNNYEFPDLIRVAIKDMGDPFDLHCKVTYSDFGESFQLAPNSVLIDMNELVYIMSPEKK